MKLTISLITCKLVHPQLSLVVDERQMLIKPWDVSRTFNEVGPLLSLQARDLSLSGLCVGADNVDSHPKVVTHDRLVTIVDERTTQQLGTDRGSENNLSYNLP